MSFCPITSCSRTEGITIEDAGPAPFAGGIQARRENLFFEQGACGSLTAGCTLTIKNVEPPEEKACQWGRGQWVKISTEQKKNKQG